ncbi:DNA ligase [Paenibacillus sp. PL2-23]|uniref:ATP-dependent DNA ligase n=1 Tax=Paenibacillus sp. PL2-23 TaxID=2100729 RepID=UPI0030FABF9A
MMPTTTELRPVHPFEPVRTATQPEGRQWTAQIKWDGVRMLTYYDGSNTRLVNRNLNDRTLQYPELLDVRTYCRANSVILDGEIIAFQENRPSFYEVMKRDRLRAVPSIKAASARTPVTYMIFDILYQNGAWVIDKTLAERQALLQSLIIPRPNIQLVQNAADGEALFHLMKQYGMEGIMYKDLGSAYAINGKDGRWRKRKVFHDLIAVIGGVTLRDRLVNSLLLGVYTESGQLQYIGHAGGGKLTRKDWTAITEMAAGLRAERMPFANTPERSKDAVWITPALTVKVEYLELTPGGTMRHPTLQAIVDRPGKDCTTDQLS